MGKADSKYQSSIRHLFFVQFEVEILIQSWILRKVEPVRWTGFPA
ncbi:hypothetical protein [Nostoc spongiaeforme]|nr:hypothetical protein [Nostoc spongiaeforme]